MQYAITVTLKPLRRLDPDVQDDLARVELLSACEHHWGLTVRTKTSLVCELTQAGNPHYHGILECHGTIPSKYPLKYLQLRLNSYTRMSKILGFVCVKLLEHFYVWKDYCLEDLNVTRDLLRCWPVVLDQISILPSYNEIVEP